LLGAGDGAPVVEEGVPSTSAAKWKTTRPTAGRRGARPAAVEAAVMRWISGREAAVMR
jgi:hypothetical protein